MDAKMMSRLTLVVCLLFTVVYAAEHIEQDSMKFYFDNVGRYLVATTHSTCYMVKLTLQEADHVHTNQGLEDLQLKMIHAWLGTLTETKVFHGDSFLPTNIANWCNRHDIYVLDRPAAGLSTVQSPLSTVQG